MFKLIEILLITYIMQVTNFCVNLQMTNDVNSRHGFCIVHQVVQSTDTCEQILTLFLIQQTYQLVRDFVELVT